MVEIKGGIDPAGVLERFGAVLKSFKSNPEARTYLTVQESAYTDKAEKKIKSDENIDEVITIRGLHEEDYEEAAKGLVDSFCQVLDMEQPIDKSDITEYNS